MGYYNYFRGRMCFRPDLNDEQARILGEKMNTLDLEGYNSYKLIKYNDGWSLQWDECDSKYDWYEIWIRGIVDLVKESGHHLYGTILYKGENYLDSGFMQVIDNNLKIYRAHYGEDVPRLGQEYDFCSLSWDYPDCMYNDLMYRANMQNNPNNTPKNTPKKTRKKTRKKTEK